MIFSGNKQQNHQFIYFRLLCRKIYINYQPANYFKQTQFIGVLKIFIFTLEFQNISFIFSIKPRKIQTQTKREQQH